MTNVRAKPLIDHGKPPVSRGLLLALGLACVLFTGCASTGQSARSGADSRSPEARSSVVHADSGISGVSRGQNWSIAPRSNESRWYQEPDEVAGSTDPVVRARSEVVVQAIALVGTPYRYGGTDASHGVDCSGLVTLVYQAVSRVSLPRTSRAMSGVGESVSVDSLLAGDLVFFNTEGRFSHVGIYVGDGRFVHAPRRGKTVSIASMDNRYWRKRFNGARRLLAPGSRALFASND